jgi:hypothetical protein
MLPRQKRRVAAHVRTALLRATLRGNPAGVRLKDDHRRHWGIRHDRHSLQRRVRRVEPTSSRIARRTCAPGLFLAMNSLCMRRPASSRAGRSKRYPNTVCISITQADHSDNVTGQVADEVTAGL